MAKIFLSYRRDDSSGHAGRLYDRLTQAFGRKNTFFDIDAIPPGTEFSARIKQAVGMCDVLVVVIGKNWLKGTHKDPYHRIEDPEDFVRIEVQTALERDIKVIPVLVAGAKMPLKSELPQPLNSLAGLQAMEVSDLRFPADSESLIAAIKEVGIQQKNQFEDHVSKFSLNLLKQPKSKFVLVGIAMVSILGGVIFWFIVDHKSQEHRSNGLAPILSTTSGNEGDKGSIPVDLSSSTVKRKNTGPKQMASLMILVPGGDFEMGSVAGVGGDDEQPLHHVYVDAFYMDKYPVTVQDYNSFLKSTGGKPPRFWKEANLQRDKKRPVVGVSWFDSNAYCNSMGKRLPTEPEWEKTARGTDGRQYPWGNEKPTRHHVNFDSEWSEWNGYRTLTNVDEFPSGKSPYGVYDMAGNVCEWVGDWYGEFYYKNSNKKNPKGPARGDKKVIRGGSWKDKAEDLRSTFRDWLHPSDKTPDVGFRCAKGA